MSIPASPVLVPPGLKGVAVADTTIGSVRGDEGFFHYRHYNAVELARTRSVEEIWHLLLFGELPTDDELIQFRDTVGRGRQLAASDQEFIAALARRIEAPHLVLQAATGLLVPLGRPTLDLSPEERTTEVLRVAAAAPTILATIAAVRSGVEPPAANPDLSHAEDWLRMLGGSTASAKAVEAYLAVTIDHGFNASTFATRVVTSTGTDVAGALGAGVAALAGPLHGGAPARALSMIEEIGDPGNTERWVKARLARGDKIMGFGHAVYRAGDPRSALMREVAEDLASTPAELDLVERAIEIEQRTLAELRRFRPGAVIVTNVEFYAGVVLHLAGVPAEAFTSCFTVSRIIGWSAHILEQAANNKIMRPAARYVGPEPLRVLVK